MTTPLCAAVLSGDGKAPVAAPGFVRRLEEETPDMKRYSVSCNEASSVHVDAIASPEFTCEDRVLALCSLAVFCRSRLLSEQLPSHEAIVFRVSTPQFALVAAAKEFVSTSSRSDSYIIMLRMKRQNERLLVAVVHSGERVFINAGLLPLFEDFARATFEAQPASLRGYDALTMASVPRTVFQYRVAEDVLTLHTLGGEEVLRSSLTGAELEQVRRDLVDLARDKTVVFVPVEVPVGTDARTFEGVFNFFQHLLGDRSKGRVVEALRSTRPRGQAV
jgi:hypothetical protein